MLVKSKALKKCMGFPDAVQYSSCIRFVLPGFVGNCALATALPSFPLLYVLPLPLSVVTDLLLAMWHGLYMCLHQCFKTNAIIAVPLT